MKLNYLINLLSVYLLSSFINYAAFAQNSEGKESYATLWHQIDSLEQLGVHKSANEIAQKVYEKAKNENNADHLVKAVMAKLIFFENKEEDATPKLIESLEKEVAMATFPVKPVLQSMLAELYWSYYQENRWELRNRTATTVDFVQKDIRTWDIEKLINAVILNYQLSLQDKEKLQATNLDIYYEILSGDRSISRNNLAQIQHRELRPTLYDFLAHRTIDFFVNSEAGFSKPTFAYQLAEKEYFAPITDFANFNIESKDTTNLLLQGIKILQDLAKFRLKGKKTESLKDLQGLELDALLDIDLKRIEIIQKNSVLRDKEKYYFKALATSKQQYLNSSLLGEVDMKLAEYWKSKANSYKKGQIEDFRLGYVKAVEICEEVLKKYPNSLAADKADGMLSVLKQQLFTLKAEEITAANTPQRMLVTSRNIKKLYFRVIKVSSVAMKKIGNYDNIKKYYLQQLKQATVVKFESIDNLLQDNDYHTHSFEIKIPALPYGEYMVMGCENPNFDIEKSPNSGILFQISDMSLIYSKYEISANDKFLVLNRTTGKPLPNIKARLEHKKYNTRTSNYEYIFLDEKITDKDGLFILETRNSGSDLSISLSNPASTDTLRIKDYFYNYLRYDAEDDKNIPIYKTFFFTDRKIYRPSQPIHFKVLLTVKKNGKTSIVPNAIVEVAFDDVNNKEIASVKLTTNEYGTASGTFTAPNNRLTGRMSLSSKFYGFVNDKDDEDDYDEEIGEYEILVEEYKRPKFEITYEKVKGSFRLREKLTVKGIAKAYSGANIDNAEVNYRVVRNTRYSYWDWYSRGSQPNSPEMEITNGVTKSDKNGNFEVIFEAIPDLQLDKATNPIFSYTVHADITDLNGETQSKETTISVGYKTLVLETALSNMYNISKTYSVGTEQLIEFSVKNLNGNPENFTGTYTVSKLVAPTRILRTSYWERPDKFYISQVEYEKDFPNDIYKEEDKMKNWVKTPMQNGEVTNLTPEFLKLKDLQEGVYHLQIEGKDIFGELVTYETYFTIVKPSAKKPLFAKDFSFIPLKIVYEVGETAQFLVTSSYKDMLLRYEIRQGQKLLSTHEILLSNEQKIIKIPIKEEHRGNISINYLAVYNSRSYASLSTIYVPYTNKALDITFETFRDKLQTGQQEEWRIKIKPKLGDKVMAEMVATLYDASLDAFEKNEFVLSYLKYHYLYEVWKAYSFTSSSSSEFIGYHKPYYQNNWFREYDKLYWFGFNIGTWQYDHNQGANLVKVKSRFKIRGITSVTANNKVKSSTGDIVLNVAMEADSKALNEVVVTAYGTTDRRSLASSSVSIVGNSLEGRAAGVQIRGTSSISATKEPTPKKTDEDFSGVTVRKNFNETAFFEPHLQTDSEGNIVIKFTIPEALTKWKMLGFAHTKDLKYGFVENSLVTQKDLMLVPNAPRFFRENDKIVLSTKITNLSDRELSGQVKLELLNALTSKTPQGLKALAGLQNFTVKAGQSSSVSWSFAIPESVQALTYRIVAKSGTFSDGEEMTLPVLTNRMLVTETLPLPMRSKETKQFTFNKLAENKSTTLRNHKLTLEFTSNPAWYAIQALPYLMEYPYECAEQTFSRFYANSIASHIANSSPKIKAVFDSWKNIPDSKALVSNLEKNQELKSLMLEETPWVLQGQNETERKKRVGLLFDLIRMSTELDKTITKLEKIQVSNGGFPWFDGMSDSRWVTQHIVAGIGHLKKLNVTNTGNSTSKVRSITDRAIPYLDTRIKEDYDRLVKYCKENKLNLEEQKVGYDVIHYLYTRSFFLEKEIPSSSKEAVSYYLGQVRKHWLEQGVYMQGMIALADFRFKQHKSLLGFKNLTNLQIANDILNSLKEKALHHEELGMYWKDMMNGYYWYQAPIETQALLIEAFSEITKDTTSVDEMKIWLLKQKQTQDWKTTKATTEACYALLLQGTDWLADSKLAEVMVGGSPLTPKGGTDVITSKTPPLGGGGLDIQADAGTGYFKTSWSGGEITPEMGKITVTNPNNVVAWGGMYWQYFEQLDKITPAETPLKINKQLFLQKNTDKGLELSPLTDKNVLKVGDLVKVRIEIRVDRAMEYVHLKDMRASCFEPINVLSSYKYQGGLGYYEATKDASTNFFIAWLPQGTYVFEYPLRVTHEGNFSNGITSIQCMYAPEFSSHSEGIRVEVGK